MGWRLWTRERVPASTFQEMVQDQAVLQFASASARDAAIPVGNRKPGMLAYTADTFAYWTWSTAGGGRWDALAIADAGWATAAVNGGWSAVAGHLVRLRRLGNSRVGMSGWFTNAGAYTANGTQTPLTLPAGWAPKADRVVNILCPGGGRAVGTVTPGGLLRIDYTSQQLAAGTTHFLDDVTYDLLETGT